ncbi:hypothetical protein BJX96DRAFT_128025 [Aspergillus floccosus]
MIANTMEGSKNMAKSSSDRSPPVAKRFLCQMLLPHHRGLTGQRESNRTTKDTTCRIWKLQRGRHARTMDGVLEFVRQRALFVSSDGHWRRSFCLRSEPDLRYAKHHARTSGAGVYFHGEQGCQLLFPRSGRYLHLTRFAVDEASHPWNWTQRTVEKWKRSFDP